MRRATVFLSMSCLILTASIVLQSRIAWAAPKRVSFEREYSYQAGEADSKLSCRAIAVEQVKRLLLEELGTYLKSETVVRNSELTKDEITTMTAGIVSTVIIEERWDGSTYVLKARMTADPDEVAGAVLAVTKEREKDIQLEESRRIAAEAMKEIERLRSELANAQGGTERKSIADKYRKAAAELGASSSFEQAHALWFAGRYDESVRILDGVISANPSYASAYILRGADFWKLHKPALAVKDLGRAIELDPTNPKAHLIRGAAYREMREYRKSEADFDRALKLKPDFAAAYFHRSLLWRDSGLKARFLNDLRLAASLGHEKAAAMLRKRGETY